MASLRRALVSATRPRNLHYPRHYSESLYRPANKWQLEGVPRPRSILDDDDADVDLSEDSAVVDGAHPGTPPLHMRRPSGKPTPHEYKAHRETLRKAFPQGWGPPRKLSREAMDALRQLHRAEPRQFPVPVLADRFKISPEAVRRILKSTWEPSVEARTALAIRERAQRQEFVQERAAKEKAETRQVRELRKLSRPVPGARPRPRSRDDAAGVSPDDTFTFQ